MKKLLILITISFFIPNIFGQKIFFGAEGFGSDSRGAYETTANPTILIVNTLEAASVQTGANSGSFEWCITRNYPRIILFEVGGTCDYRGIDDQISLNQNYCNVYGQTAPWPGFELIGCDLSITANHVLLQHIKVRPGGQTGYGNVTSRDAISIYGNSIVIDHCSLGFATDEQFSIPNTGNPRDITLSNSIITWPFDDVFNNAQKAIFLEESATRVSLIKNFSAFTADRNPHWSAYDVVFLNNYTYTDNRIGAQFRDHSPAGTGVMIGNYIDVTPRSSNSYGYLMNVRSGEDPNSEIYCGDNWCRVLEANPEYTQYQCVNFVQQIKTLDMNPFDMSGYTILDVYDVPDYIKANAGAFYWARDTVDSYSLTLAIDERCDTCMIEQYSDFWSSVYYDVVDQTTCVLNIPDNPHGDNNGNGYTNLEEWVAGFGSEGYKSVVFEVRNSLNNQPVSDAEIELTGFARGTTNYDGIVTFTNIPEGSYYEYMVSKSGYLSVSDYITVSSDMNINISLIQEIDIIPPSTPQNLTGSPVSSSQVYLSWDASTDNIGVAGYIIYRNDIEIDRTGSLAFSDLNLDPETSYEYSISAYDNAGNESSKSNHVIITTFANTDTEPPNQPQNLNAYEIHSNEIKLTWYASTDNIGVTGYNVFRNGVHIYTCNDLNYADGGLSPQTGYTYSVTAFDQAGNESSHSNSISVTTLSQTDFEPPTTPMNLEGTSLSSSQISLSWSSATDNVGIAGYNVFRNGVHVYTSDNLNHTDTGLNPETEYTYSITAFDQAGNESSHSNSISVTTLSQTDFEPPTTPTNLEGTSVSSSQISLSWSPATDNVSVAGYNMFRNGIHIFTSVNLHYIDTGLDSETEYFYSITAFDEAGNESPKSNEVSIETLSEENIVYIDPESDNNDPPDGSIDAPYKSWGQVEWMDGYSYLQKRNTTSYEPKILITSNNIKMGSYGWGERPKIITTATDYALSFYEKKGIVISNIEIIADGAIAAIYFAGFESDSNYIEGCRLTGGDYCLRIVGGVNYKVKYNEFSADINALYTMAANTDIYYNEFIDNQTAIHINDFSSEVKIYNNVFKGNQEGVSSSYGGLTLYNNIFLLDMPGSVAISQEKDSILSDFNIFYPERYGFIQIADNLYDDLLSYQMDQNMDANSQNSDPLFIDADNEDFRLQEGSPAIEAGVDIGLYQDKFGSVVPFGNYPDIGIQETEQLINPISIQNIEQQMGIYPNPNNGSFTLELLNGKENDIFNLRIADMKGNYVYVDYFLSGKWHQLSVNHLPPGQYILLADINNQTYTSVLVIK